MGIILNNLIRFQSILVVLAPVVVGIITGTFTWLAARRVGRYSLQQRAVDLATKRLSFWESYARAAMAVNSSDPTARQSIEKQVYEAIQQVRSDADAELMRVSWSQLIRDKRPPEKPLRTGDKLSYWFLTILAWVCLLIFLPLSLLMLMRHNLSGYIILLSFGMLSFSYIFYLSRTIKYKPDDQAIDKI